MISNSTGMDVFDRGFEPMCYSVQQTANSMKSFSSAVNNFSNIGSMFAVNAADVKAVVSFSCWHIKRSDLLTLSSRLPDGRRKYSFGV